MAILYPVLGQGVAERAGVRHPERVVEYSAALLALVLAAAGLLIVNVRPRHSIGWLMILMGFIEISSRVGQTYGIRALVMPEQNLPWGGVALALAAPLWLVAVCLPVTSLMLRYPSGRIEGAWARRVDKAVLAGLACFWLGYAGLPTAVTDSVLGHESALLLPKAVVGVLLAVAAFLVLSGIVFSLSHTARRTWRAAYPERQQLAWLMTVAPPAFLTFFLPFEQLQKGSYALPVAIMIGVLRYRLLGIQVVIRRTLLYGSLTGLTLLVFVAVTAGLTSLLPRGPAPLVVAASLIAVGLVPARDRLQKVVDRFVYGASGDPVAALAQLANPVSQGKGLLESVVQTIGQGLRSPGVSVLAGRQSTTWGELGEDPLVEPLVIAGATVGELLVAPRSGERRPRREDKQFVAALAPLVAAVVQSVTLTEQIRVEQERVVLATEAERSRIRHDLHDGLGPSLTGIALGLEAVESADALRSRAIVARLRQEVAAALEEVRRILEDLRPGALESADLLALLRSRAASLTAATPLRVTVEAPPHLPPLPPEVESAAWRVFEEALTNVVRHSGATSCRVTLVADDTLQLLVVDDGCGYSGPRAGGVGLASMRERASRLGGSFAIEQRSQGGTAVTVELPLGVQV
jgi:signal transduction histidine kinase